MKRQTRQAYILIVDIVAFSERSARDQFGYVNHLMDTFEAHPLVKASTPGDYFNSTGDGFVYAVPTAGDSDLAEGICDLARRLVTHAGEKHDADGRPLEIRAGLHIGQITTSKDLKSRRQKQMVVGHGLNWAARVASHAAPSQVLASAEFVDFIDDQLDAGFVSANFETNQPDRNTSRSGWQVPVKHGRTAEVYVLNGLVSIAPPPALERIERIAQHLEDALEIIGVSVTEALVGDDDTLASSADELRPRLTLWVPEDGTLRSVRPRVELPSNGVAPPSRSTTQWPLPTPGEAPKGPVATAFTTQEPCCVTGLPDWRAENQKEAYVRRWEAEGVTATTTVNFSRKSRAIICVPLVLHPQPAGVLCIDLMHPLSDVADLADLMARRVKLRWALLLASLLHLRSV